MTPTLHRRTGTHQPPAPRSQTPSPFLGRLEFPTCHGPRSVIVECVRAGDGYTLHLPAFNEAGNYLIDAPVSLTTVDEHPFSPDACIRGRSRVIADGEVAARTVELLERWPDGPAAHYFHITPATNLAERPTPPHRGTSGERHPPGHPHRSTADASALDPGGQSRG